MSKAFQAQLQKDYPQALSSDPNFNTLFYEYAWNDNSFFFLKDKHVQQSYDTR